ncbi:hypothetical protein N7508_008968 [Penicillium antarcticum]|uniref:uncharacterized protein n=1 Tax=Penicillium antarcticum TaxID=416450 RepID=UPI0023A42329|nr:uncharacterized protein N7508_008968 [Penicillium antarcticum]KAJ5294147.1 hypothetical protein N7508_008968 [Penicillium antarcticum]
MSSLLERASGDASIDRSVQNWNYACQSLCIIGMTVFFGLRMYTRVFILSGLGTEDCELLRYGIKEITFVKIILTNFPKFLGISYSIIALVMGHYGGGLHWSDVHEEDKIPFQKTIYVTMVMYGPTAYLTKVCLLWIMTRVFSPFRKCIIFIRIFMGIMLAYYIPAVIVKIRICNPIPRFWDPKVAGTCLDKNSIILADAVVSVVSDLIVLILPIPLTLSLQMSTKRKNEGAGGLAVASSIIRLALIMVTGQSADASFAFMRINMLGNAEVAIGVICTCLPALSALVIRLYNEYSSNKATLESYKMSSMKNQTRTERSKNQLSVRELDSDEDGLVYNAQGNPRVETTIRGDSPRQEGAGGVNFDGIGITRTVDVSTSVETR